MWKIFWRIELLRTTALWFKLWIENVNPCLHQATSFTISHRKNQNSSLRSFLFTEENRKTRHIDFRAIWWNSCWGARWMTIIGVKSYSSALVYVHEIANKTVIVSWIPCLLLSHITCNMIWFESRLLHFPTKFGRLFNFVFLRQQK